MKKIILFLALPAFFTACAKHNNDVEDVTPQATIVFSSPAQGAVYNPGDSVLIQGTAVSTATVHGYDLIIRNAPDTAKLYFAHFHEHNATLLINTKWKANVSSTALQAEVILYLDHDGHTASRKVGFTVR